MSIVENKAMRRVKFCKPVKGCTLFEKMKKHKYATSQRCNKSWYRINNGPIKEIKPISSKTIIKIKKVLPLFIYQEKVKKV